MKKLFLIAILIPGIANANDLIKDLEGFISKPKLCQGQRLTIGYGTQCAFVDCSKPITKETAEIYMNEHLNKRVRPYLNINDLYTKNEIEAIESIVYNIGGSAWNKSKIRLCIEKSHVKGWINRLKYRKEIQKYKQCVDNEWMRWNQVGGKVVKYQTERRQKELQHYKGK